MKHAKTRIAASVSPQTATPEAAFAALDVDFSVRPRQTLTAAQLRFPVLRLAFEHIEEEATERKGRYLRRLDRIHASGSRTHQQVWDALRAIRSALLARVNLATLVLGWFDAQGELHLNRQSGIAEDSDLTPSRVSRTFKALERAGYMVRKPKRFCERGRWITRMAIRFTYQFFTDLGLAHVLAKTQQKHKAQQEKKCQAAQQKRQQQRLHEAVLKQTRQAAQHKAQSKQPSGSAPQALHGVKLRPMPMNAAQAELSRQRTKAALLLQAEHPEATPQQLIDWINERYPLS